MDSDACLLCRCSPRVRIYILYLDRENEAKLGKYSVARLQLRLR